MASQTDARLARALSFSLCMKYDTESSEEEQDEGRDYAAELAEQVLEPPERLHNRNSSIMGDFAAIEQELALQQPVDDVVAMPPPASRKPAKKQAANEVLIQVCLRVRPPSEREADDENCITELTSKSVTFEPTVKSLQSAHQVTSETYFFDRVFAPEATQTEVYEGSVESIVRGVVAGRPGLVFAFGITNAGKTFTIQGNTEHPGILPRALGQLFSMTKSDSAAKVSLSFMEIYNENVYDLLAAREADAAANSMTKGSRTGPLGPALQLQDVKDGVVVKGLTHRTIETVEQAANHLAEGIEFRQVAHTDSNHESSRSHSLVTLTLERGDGTSTKLVVVDLAGSERAKKTNADLTLKESARINTSLMNLGRCLEVLRANQKLVGSKRKFRQVVPFRQAKITRVLREPLTGGGNVVMLCSIYGGSSDADETVHALRYASTAREVATLGAVSDRFLPAVATNPKKRSLVPRCAEVGSKANKEPRASTMPTIGEPGDESFVSSVNSSFVSAAEATVESKSTSKSDLLAQLHEAQATIAQLRAQVEANDQVTANLEDEIREEMAEEMESVMNQMEETYQSKLEREIAIHEERFQHKLGILDHFGLDEPQRSPARVARELLELEQLRKDNTELKQTMDAQLAAVKSECARELEEVRVQHSTNVQMEVDTLEHQLSEVNEENSRLKKELNAVRRQLQHVTQVSQSLIAARAEMQATAAAATTSAGQAEPRKTEKKEKASRKKKRKKDDATVAKNNIVGKPAALSAGNSSVAMDPPTDTKTVDLDHTEKGLVETDIGTQTLIAALAPASGNTRTKREAASKAEAAMKEPDVGSDEDEPRKIGKTPGRRDTTDQGTAKSMEVEVAQVVKEMVGKVVQAGSQDAHHAARTLGNTSISQEPPQSAKATVHMIREDDSTGRPNRAEVERNYVGNENMLEKLRKSDFESKVHHDCNELRAEVRHDYNEAHMADAAGHTHLSGEHKHSEAKDIAALKARLATMKETKTRTLSANIVPISKPRAPVPSAPVLAPVAKAPDAAVVDVPSAAAIQRCCHDTPATDEGQTMMFSQGGTASTTAMPVRAARSAEEQDGTATICTDKENIVEKKSDAQQAQTAELSSGLSMTDQLKNRLQRLKKASAATASSSRSGATNATNQAGAPAPRPEKPTEKTQQVAAASEPGEGQSKENHPPTPAQSSRKRRTTGKVDEEVERFEALEQAAAADMGSNRRLTRSAMRQRV